MSISHRLPILAPLPLALALALVLSPAEGEAQELVIFQDVPSVDELNSVLFGAEPKDEPAAMKTRAIRFHADPPPPQAPAQPAPQQAAADPQPAQQPAAPAQQPAEPAPAPTTTAAAPAAAASPAPPPPSGTALGLNILFEYDSTRVLPESVPYLERLGEVLTLPENQEKVINIIGHTDASGSAAYNQQLSEERALVVGQYLVNTWNVDPNRLGVEGRGKSQPLTGTDPFDGINRRVEFYSVE